MPKTCNDQPPEQWFKTHTHTHSMKTPELLQLEGKLLLWLLIRPELATSEIIPPNAAREPGTAAALILPTCRPPMHPLAVHPLRQTEDDKKLTFGRHTQQVSRRALTSLCTSARYFIGSFSHTC
ncbi:unnamed protein product [Ectocarpus fasciculatus]